jgi:hypothetical protein
MLSLSAVLVATNRCQKRRLVVRKDSARIGAGRCTGKARPQAKVDLRYQTGRVKPKSASEAIEIARGFEPENLSRETSPLRCERLNDSTFKITNGELTTVPASHGQWPGYRTTKAVACIIKLGPDAWLARCGDQVCGPSPFSEAKANALAMARGADGDYFVRKPISHLNGLQARLLDKEDPAND